MVRHGGRLVVRLRASTTDLDERGSDALVDGFVTSAAVLRHLLDDPLLPPSLLPDRWSGTALRREFERCDARWQSVFREWIASVR
ncbi:PaaX family transcriptional regulator C-terminal domain-containing protein [Aeromicrobium sp. UC242_57]|uniref:PaaX family transcriptional regulator C-terminal domain-containing protein n=1 Tax=Aeromicrobium sp. UC242_57 TaxID=3374624 RepID=UPI0037A6906F